MDTEEKTETAENVQAEAAPEDAAPEKTAEAPSIEPFAEEISFDTFAASDMRVCKVLACGAVKKSKKLLRFTLDDGQILSGIHAYYEPEELVGKTVVAIVNIPPRKMMGLDSCGMLLSAIHQEDGVEHLNLVMLDDAIPAGAKLC